MAEFERITQDIRDIEKEIARKGIVLGIDWSDTAQVRQLAHEAIYHHAEAVRQVAGAEVPDYRLMAKVDLFGLAASMLRIMQDSAEDGVAAHGGPIWKALAKALWAEAEGKIER